MSRASGVWLVLAVWSAIYLTRLGTLEIKGEEGRRILPAIAMLQSGNFIVPYVGSDPYFSKPPLVNWLVAASFKLSGLRNEWTARLPSALAVLAVALAFAFLGQRTLGPNGAVAGALVWMTNFGIIEKGRLIEIEALYASLCGLAVVCWLSWWQEERSRWFTWVVPWSFLGLGMLAKGPLHLVFFYAIVCAVLYQHGELRKLWSGAHLLGIVLMLGIFAAWAIPCLQLMEASDVTHTWTRQFSGRLTGEDFNLSGWLMNIPRGLCYFLPWTPLLPFVNKARFSDGRQAAVAKGLLWGIAISFVAVSLLPGTLPRYTMPLLAPASWLIAMVLVAGGSQLPDWLRLRRPSAFASEVRLPALVAIAACLGIAVYALAVMPFLAGREKVRNIAAQINAALPATETLYAVNPDYQPSLFYVLAPIVYVHKVAEVPATARYLLVQPETENQAITSRQWQPLQAQPVLRLRDYRDKEVSLLKVGAEVSRSSS